MIQACIIGSGNVAQHLAKAFAHSTSVDIVQVLMRSRIVVCDWFDASKIIDDFKDLAEVPLYFIAVSDDAIAAVSSQIPFHNKLIVHTSGSRSINDLMTNNRKGVFYPLQTFSKSIVVDFKVVPICLEAHVTDDYKLLEIVAKSISSSVFEVNSEQRKALHVAAVFVNNFTNHLYEIGKEICDENKVSFEILKPLIQETAKKITTLSPNDAQTGPAKRGDFKTIESHLLFLSNQNSKNIYKLLTQSIIDNGKKL